MTDLANEMSVELPCHRCGYDLRAQPNDGTCPECGASVAEARRVAAVPLRPAWRDSDPRWRRRVLAGVWVLVLLPLMDVLRTLDLTSSVRVPTVIGARDSLRTLDDSLLNSLYLYNSLAFCVGTALLFSKERGRRRTRLDWTRRWGVLCCYVVLLLTAAQLFYISALVVVGIAALFVGMPVEQQPAATQTFIDVGAACLRYGPNHSELAIVLPLAFSSLAVLLACVALYDALRSSGPKRLAVALVTPLALLAGLYLVQVGRYLVNYPNASPNPFRIGVFFWPELAARHMGELTNNSFIPGYDLSNAYAEALKWCVVLAIAVWLSVAQLAAWRTRRAKPPNLSDTPA